MTQRDKILKTIEDSMENINAVDDNIIGECIGVSQALGDLRKALDKIDICLEKRTYSEAASLGYSHVASAFIFLQRALGGLQHADNQKEELVSDIALKSGVGVHEEVAPFVDDVLVSSKELSEEEKKENKSAVEREQAKNADMKRKKTNPRSGSTLEGFLKEAEQHEDCQTDSTKKVLLYKMSKVMERK